MGMKCSPENLHDIHQFQMLLKSLHVVSYTTVYLLLSKLKYEVHKFCTLNPIALRKAKIVYNFGLSECNRVTVSEERKSSCLVG